MRDYARQAESSKQAVAGLQRQLNDQREAFENERRERTLAMQALDYESGRRGDVENCLDFERGTVQKLIDFVNRLEFPKREGSCATLPDDTSLGFFHEWQVTKSEVGYLQGQLERTVDQLHHKQLILENLSADLEIPAQDPARVSM